MNIFALSNSPFKAAQYLCDKHIVKMPLETAQILCTVVNKIHGCRGKGLYKSTHQNHPCTKWAAMSYLNFLWLVTHGLAICDQYRLRYGKTHKAEEIIKLAYHLAPVHYGWKHSKFSPPPRCMPEDCKVKGVVASYRNYYRKYKLRFAKWNFTPKPQWL